MANQSARKGNLALRTIAIIPLFQPEDSVWQISVG
jgi:hypothetical protein